MGLVYLPATDLPPVPRPGVEHRPSDSRDRRAERGRAGSAAPRRGASSTATSTAPAGGAPAARRVLGRRDRGRARGRRAAARVELDDPAGRAGPVASGPLRRAAARRSCRRARRRAASAGHRQRSSCRRAPRRWSSTSTRSRRPSRSQTPTDLVLPAGPARRGAGRRRGGRSPPRCWRRCARARGSCSSRCGCSTPTPTTQRLGAGLKSLAFALRLRAPDRTLTIEQATEVRDAAIARAARTLRRPTAAADRHDRLYLFAR